MDSSSSPPTAANNPAGISLATEQSPLKLHGDQFTRLVWAVVLLGIGCRLLRYLLRFPLWGDECMLAENIIVRTPAGLWEPLDNGQVAPVGYTEASGPSHDSVASMNGPSASSPSLRESSASSPCAPSPCDSSPPFPRSSP